MEYFNLAVSSGQKFSLDMTVAPYMKLLTYLAILFVIGFSTTKTVAKTKPIAAFVLKSRELKAVLNTVNINALVV